MLDWKRIRRKYSSKSKVFSFEMLIYAALLKAAAHLPIFLSYNCSFFLVGTNRVTISLPHTSGFFLLLRL